MKNQILIAGLVALFASGCAMNRKVAQRVTGWGDPDFLAQVCCVNELPFIIFRSASDLAGGSGSQTAEAELDQFFEVAADNSSKVVTAFLGEL